MPSQSVLPRFRIRVVLLLGALTACAPALSNRPNLESLMAAYRAQNAPSAFRADSTDRSHLKWLEVWTDSGRQLTTLDAVDAPLVSVVRAVLVAADIPYVFDDVDLVGRVSARLERRPVLDALNDLLVPRGYRAIPRGSGVAISYASTADAGRTAATDPIHLEVPILHLDAKAVSGILDGGLRGGSVGAIFIAARSVVLLSGPRTSVEDAREVLHRADRPTDHVFIEALVVEFDVETMRNVSLSVAGLQSGKVSGLAFIPGNLSGDLLTFMHALGAKTPQQFVAVVQAIAGNDKARVVARPFISTRSGEPANLNIGRTRTYITQSVQTTGLMSVGQSTVESGVILKMTPTALPGDRVRIDTHVEESQFLPTSGNIAAEKDQNVAESSMEVPSGQTIVIGGLSLDRSSATGSGIPILRSIPLLRLLFSNDAETGKRQEVVIFLTPRIWQPGMDAPLVSPEAFDLDSLMRPLRKKP
ncbi:MAG: type and secretion system protein [Gemmatimonadetes bacterium]|nr:type and secretion system protein [Gemmatimonadota bacterium]